LDTKLVKSINIDEDEMIELVSELINKNNNQIYTLLKDEIAALKYFLDSILNEAKKLLEDNWVYMENKNVYYVNEIVALHPDLNEYKCGGCSCRHEFNSSSLNLRFNGYSGTIMSIEEIKKIYNPNIKNPYVEESSNCLYFDDNFVSYLTYFNGNTYCFYGIEHQKTYSFNQFFSGYTYHIPVFRLSRNNSHKLSTSKVLELWLKYGLIPEKLPNKFKDVYKNIIVKLYIINPQYFAFSESNIELNIQLLLKEVYEDKATLEINELKLNREYILNQAKLSGTLNVSDISSLSIMDKLLYCEKTRADIESYDEKILSDPNRGHWDLWEEETEEREKLSISIEIAGDLMGRNPLSDIKDDGVIGIDFGTKSTIVVYQEDNDHTLPMRVGMGHYSKKIESKHYENPTVMEFIDIESFLQKYNEKEGRPGTIWEDLTVSHTAFNSLMESNSENYYSFLSELKQWAGDKRRQIRLRDKNNKDVILPSYLNVTDENLDPIELYAYYIGLYINNMHNGIYIDYTLSFPVTYEKSVREKIVESFTKGIKKSLPVTVLKNEEVMNKFRVVPGASEPAAYAICALEEYKFEPMDDEEVFYGVFDFGGGTTDYDFGLWREASRKERRYDFVIEHFGAGGDQYLGGENLLELMAFEIFKDNQDKLRENGITFVLPPECKRFAGSEILLSDSQEAKINMKQLMEKLRPLWEKHEGYEKEFEKGVIKVNLFDKTGQYKLNYELLVDKEVLEKLLYTRIEKGVRNFFDSLKLAFSFDETKNVKSIKIFLAGNSSKSQMVIDIFDKYIEQETNEINKDNGTENKYFEVFPPLGTEEAYKKQEEMGIELDKDSIIKPTGKTGVAFGLVKSRKGGKIKVIDKNTSGDEIKFKYFIGYSKRGKFTVVTDREVDYNKWNYFIDASEEDFEIYYTTLPEASNNSLDIKEVHRKKLRIDKTSDEAGIYIRAIKPSVIEYVVAFEDEISNNKFLNEVVEIELTER